VFTPFHKPPYPYLYGRSVDETTTDIKVPPAAESKIFLEEKFSLA
jgi:hypothetical protein